MKKPTATAKPKPTPKPERQALTIGHVLAHLVKHLLKDAEEHGTSPSSVRICQCLFTAAKGADMVDAYDADAFCNVIGEMVDEVYEQGYADGKHEG